MFPLSGESPSVSSGPALLSLLHMSWTQIVSSVASFSVRFLASTGLVSLYKEVTMVRTTNYDSCTNKLGYARRTLDFAVIPLLATALTVGLFSAGEAGGVGHTS